MIRCREQACLKEANVLGRSTVSAILQGFVASRSNWRRRSPDALQASQCVPGAEISTFADKVLVI
jgi:hypothetical protein